MQQNYFVGYILRNVFKLLHMDQDIKKFLFTADMHSIFMGRSVYKYLLTNLKHLEIKWLHDFHELVTGVGFLKAETGEFFISDEKKYVKV